jgi:hypothetical protein
MHVQIIDYVSTIKGVFCLLNTIELRIMKKRGDGEFKNWTWKLPVAYRGGVNLGDSNPSPSRNYLVLTTLSRNSLKVPKIKKILLYEMKFFVPNYSCLQNPWQGGYSPQIPVLCVLNWICWNPPPPHRTKLNAPRTKFLGTPLKITESIWKLNTENSQLYKN